MPINSKPSVHQREKCRLTQDRDKDSHAVPIHHASRIAETTDFYVQESGMPLNSRPSLHEREKCRLTQDLILLLLLLPLLLPLLLLLLLLILLLLLLLLQLLLLLLLLLVVFALGLFGTVTLAQIPN